MRKHFQHKLPLSQNENLPQILKAKLIEKNNKSTYLLLLSQLQRIVSGVNVHKAIEKAIQIIANYFFLFSLLK